MVASKLETKSVRDMLEALIGGERDLQVLAGLARGRMQVKRAALIEALTGRFDDHHAELARMLLDQIDALSAQISKLTARIGELITALPCPCRKSHPRRLSGMPVLVEDAAEAVPSVDVKAGAGGRLGDR